MIIMVVGIPLKNFKMIHLRREDSHVNHVHHVTVFNGSIVVSKGTAMSRRYKVIDFRHG